MTKNANKAGQKITQFYCRWCDLRTRFMGNGYPGSVYCAHCHKKMERIKK